MVLREESPGFEPHTGIRPKGREQNEPQWEGQQVAIPGFCYRMTLRWMTQPTRAQAQEMGCLVLSAVGTIWAPFESWQEANGFLSAAKI